MNKTETMGFMRVWVIYMCAAVLSMGFLGGCKEQFPKEAKDEAALEKAALDYWADRLVDRDYEAAYKREVDEAGMSFEEYRKLVNRNEKFTFSGLTVDRVSIEGKYATVYVGLKAVVPALPKPIERTVQDQWIYDESERWKHEFSKNQP